MKTIILCGGKGTRLREETEFRPKPMVPVGGKPILWHIMKTYAHHGHRDFILCLGYRGDIIKDFFRNYTWHTRDVTVHYHRGTKPAVSFHDHEEDLDWTVTLAETGLEAMTGDRVRAVEKYLGSDQEFLLTYGDGLTNADINAAIAHHRKGGLACTLTGVHPPGRFGELGLEKDGRCHAFNEKPQAEGGYINGGYMVCNRRLFDFIPQQGGIMLEQEPMRALVKAGQLGVHRHDGFWQPMDTYQEYLYLNRLWDAGQAPWKVW